MIEKQLKRCSKCGQWKDLSLFVKQLRRKDRHSSHCKACHNKYYIKKGPRIIIYGATKVCSKCGEEKDRSKFYKNKCNPDGNSGWCKQCSEESTLKWKEKNRDAYLRSRKQYYLKNKEKFKKYNKKYKKELYNDPEKYLHFKELNRISRQAPHRKLHEQIYQKKNRNKQNRKRNKALRDSYIKILLRRNNGIYNPSQELISEIREYLQFYRELKTLKRKEVVNGIV